MQRLQKWFQNPTVKRRTIESIAAVLLLSAVIASVTVITPYQPSRQTYSFYEAETESRDQTLYRADVVRVENEQLTATLLDGPRKDQQVTVPYERMSAFQRVDEGSRIIISAGDGQEFFHSVYRVPLLIVLLTVFILVVLLVGRRRGMMSLLGLGAGILVVIGVTIPLIVAGHDSFWVTTGSAFLIAVVSVVLAHGWNRRTAVSLIAIMTVLLGVTLLAKLVTYALGLTGVVGEAELYLTVAQSSIDLSGILVGGIVIATLGALDDIVTTQVATVDVLHAENSRTSKKELYRKAADVGGEHIAALVNTLALVYVGASLPLLVIYAVSDNDWFSLVNQGFVATEITRTLVVSIGLVLAVPFSTWLAVQLMTRKRLFRK